MKRTLLLAALLGLLLVSTPRPAAASDEPEEDDGVDESDVFVYTDANFAAEMKKTKFALVRERGGHRADRRACGAERRSHPPCRSSFTRPVSGGGVGWGWGAGGA